MYIEAKNKKSKENDLLSVYLERKHVSMILKDRIDYLFDCLILSNKQLKFRNSLDCFTFCKISNDIQKGYVKIMINNIEV